MRKTKDSFFLLSDSEWIKCTSFSIKVCHRMFLLNNCICILFDLLREGHVNTVQELLSRGANVNAATKVLNMSKIQ